MKKTKLLIFDIDGTLIDSVSGYHEVIINAMTDLGIENIDTDFNALKHHTDSYALKYNYENFFDKELPVNLLDQFENLIVTYLKTQPKTIAIKGVDKILNQLRDSEYAFAFATGSLPESAILKMKSAGLEMNAALLATSKTSFSREGFVLEAIEKAKSYYNVTEFEQIISVGDGIWDLKTAQNLDLDFIGIGTKNKAVMEANGMECWFEDFTNFEISNSCLS
ncbi:MAG: HAD family hydrolase [Flavobacteriaceae bacterium]|nr:HAD family hydrolase [Flavobacteriaceae bacterium]